MCQRVKKLWQCGHSDVEDPRRCRTAMARQRACCPEYGFAWAYRYPVIEEWDGECRECYHSVMEKAKQDANHAFVQRSWAYSHLRDLSSGDDATRQKSGRPRFERSSSTSEIVIPKGWTSAHNRLPSNANEFEQFVRGRFDPLRQLPDSHVSPRLSGAAVNGGQRALLPPNGIHSQEDQDNSHFQPQPHAFTKQAQAGGQGHRSRVPPPGFSVQVPRNVDAARFHIARHERARLTPPDQEADAIKDAECSYVEFREPGTGRARTRSGRKTCYTGVVVNASKGWLPRNVIPLPPRQETDTAPPSRSPSLGSTAAQSLSL